MDDAPKRRPTRSLPAVNPPGEDSVSNTKPEHTEVVQVGPELAVQPVRRVSKPEVPAVREKQEKETEALLDNFFDDVSRARANKSDKVPTSPNAVLPWGDGERTGRRSDTQENPIPADDLIIGPARTNSSDDLLVGSVPDPFDDDEILPTNQVNPSELLKSKRREHTQPDGTMVSPVPEPPDEPTVPTVSPSVGVSLPVRAPTEARAAHDATRVEPPPAAPPKSSPVRETAPTPAAEPRRMTRSSLKIPAAHDAPASPRPARASGKLPAATPPPASPMHDATTLTPIAPQDIKPGPPQIAFQETKLLPIPPDDPGDSEFPPAPVAAEPTSLFQYKRGSTPAPVARRKISSEIPAIKAKLAVANPDSFPSKRKGRVDRVVESFTGMMRIGPAQHLQKAWGQWSLRKQIIVGTIGIVGSIGVFTLIATLLVAAFTDRPNSDELIAAYPYGYAGQRGTRGVDAPPAVTMTFTLEGQRPCGGLSTDMCLQYRYEGANGFAGYMLLHKVGNQWQRYGLEGAPFDVELH
jgi:hypothetical protein